MKKVLLLFLLLALGATALVIGLACSANPTSPGFQAPVLTVQAGNPTLTPTATYTFTMTFTITGTPTITSTPNPFVTVTWNNAFGSYSFNSPSAIAVQNSIPGCVYVADTGNNRVEKFTNTGSLVTSWGAGGKGKGTVNFLAPQALAVNSNGTTLYVAGPSGIGVFDAKGNYLTTYTQPGTGTFNNPQGLAVDGSGNLYVSDTGNLRIVELSSNGVPLSYGSAGGVTLSAGITATGLALTGSPVTLCVAQHTSGPYDTIGFYDASSGVTEGSITGFKNPNGLAVDSNGHLFVADTGNGSIEIVLNLTLDSILPFNANKTLKQPMAVAVDSTGEIYVVDSGNGGNGTVYNFAP